MSDKWLEQSNKLECYKYLTGILKTIIDSGIEHLNKLEHNKYLTDILKDVWQ